MMVSSQTKSSSKEKGQQTENRKLEHIRICLEHQVESTIPSGFNDVTLIHNAAPELNLDEIDVTCTFLGHQLQAPVMVTAMTGGHPEALPINQHIAQAVETLGLAMCVGSQRAAIEDHALADSFSITRKAAPTAFIVGNIGAPQLALGYGVKEAKTAIEMLKADALAIHFNAAQEAVQPEGEATYADVIPVLRRLTKQISTPIIAKETGAGLNRDSAQLLVNSGVKALDVAGLGGTSWPAVEVERAKDKDVMKATLGRWFTDWGIPTAVATFEVAQIAGNLPIIASGGLRTGIDVAKALALGAKIGGVALPVLAHAMVDPLSVQRYLETVIQGLKAAMFLVGASTLEELSKAPLIIQGPTRNWLELRGYKLESLANRRLR
jgi:isopentenyl-diphosphate delta-isomerase